VPPAPAPPAPAPGPIVHGWAHVAVEFVRGVFATMGQIAATAGQPGLRIPGASVLITVIAYLMWTTTLAVVAYLVSQMLQDSGCVWQSWDINEVGNSRQATVTRFLCPDREHPWRSSEVVASTPFVPSYIRTADQCRARADADNDLLFDSSELGYFRSCTNTLHSASGLEPPTAAAHDSCMLLLSALPLDCRGDGGLAALGRFYYCPLSHDAKLAINRSPALMLSFDNRGARDASSPSDPFDDEDDGGDGEFGNRDGTQWI